VLGVEIGGGERLASILFQFRFWIEGVDMAWPAVEEQMDDVLCLGGKVGRLGKHRVLAAGGQNRSARRLARQQARQSQHPQTGSGAGKHLPARERFEGAKASHFDFRSIFPINRQTRIRWSTATPGPACPRPK